MKSRDLGTSLEHFGSSRCSCLCMSSYSLQVNRFSLVSHSTMEEASVSCLETTLTRYNYLSLWLVIHGAWYGLLSLLLSWPELLLSKCSPQTVTQGTISIALMTERVSTSLPGWTLDRRDLIK